MFTIICIHFLLFSKILSSKIEFPFFTAFYQFSFWTGLFIMISILVFAEIPFVKLTLFMVLETDSVEISGWVFVVKRTQFYFSVQFLSCGRLWFFKDFLLRFLGFLTFWWKVLWSSNGWKFIEDQGFRILCDFWADGPIFRRFKWVWLFLWFISEHCPPSLISGWFDNDFDKETR